MARWIAAAMALAGVGILGTAGLRAQDTTPKPATTTEATPPAAAATTQPAPAAATPAQPAKAEPADEFADESFMGSQGQPERLSEMLSLRDVTLLTLNNNLNVKIQRITPRITQQTVTTAQAVFDPTAQATVGGGQTDTPNTDIFGNPAHGRAESTTVSAGLTKKFVTGTQATAGVNTAHTEGYESVEPNESGVQAAVTQPLLKGGGVQVNEADIFIARNNTKVSEWGFKTQVITTVAQAQTAYWELVFALENLEVQKDSWRLSKKTLLQTEAQVEAGVLARIEITRVKADIASKEDGIITAQRAVEDQVDQLRRFIKQPNKNLTDDTGIVPLERVTYVPVKLDLMKEVNAALISRPDYIQAKINTEIQDLNLVKTKDGQLPQLDLTATLGVNGLAYNFGNSVNGVGKSGDFVNWNVGATFSYPLGNRAADAAYEQARLTKIQSLLQLRNTEDQVVIDVKAAVRSVNANAQRVRSTRLARQLAEERLAAEEEKLNVGQAIILDLLDAQTLVAQTQVSESRAIVDYQDSLIQLEQAKGTLLEANNVHLSK